MDFSTRPARIFLNRADYAASGYYRIMNPAMALRMRGLAVTVTSDRMLAPERIGTLLPDAMVLQHIFLDEQITYAKQYNTAPHKPTLVYENDDLLWGIPDDNPHKQEFPADIRKRITRATLLCDQVCVSTQRLAQAMKTDIGFQHVRVVPNRISESFFNAAVSGRRSMRPLRKPGAKLRVGWAGGISHVGDLAVIEPVVAALADEVDFVFMGLAPRGLDRKVQFVPAVPMEQYAETLGRLDLDIAIAPLADNEFNRCKSNLRLLEYGAAGYRVIATDITPYKDAPVTRVENRTDAWIEAIRSALKADPTTIEVEQEAIRDWVKQDYLLEDHLDDWLKAWLAPNDKHFTPIQQPCDTSEPLVSVGSRVADIPYFPTFREARLAQPSATVMYLRPGTRITPQQIMIARHALADSAAVCGLSNDGDFPRAGAFTQLLDHVARETTEAALFANEDLAYRVPYAAGPFTMLSATALGRLGIPDEFRFKGDIEMAIADWTARAADILAQTKIVANIFVPTIKETTHDQANRQRLNECINAWSPALGQSINAWLQDPMPALVREQLELVFYRHSYTMPTPRHYADWIAMREKAPPDSSLPVLESMPLISIIMPVFNTPPDVLREAIDSVLKQSYWNWQLCIADDHSTDRRVREVLETYVKDERIVVWYRGETGHICEASNSAMDLACGEWICCLDHDDILAPDALYIVARAINAHPDAQFFYSDSDKLSAEGTLHDPLFSPEFNYELLLGQNYVTHLSVYRTKIVQSMHGFRKGFEGSQDWDLTLRYLETACWDGNTCRPDASRIVHLPYVLYHWRQLPGSVALDIKAKPYALTAAQNAVLQHLSRTGQQAAVLPHPSADVFLMVRYLMGLDAPKVAVIVPTKDGNSMLLKCLGGLQRTVYPNKEVIIVDNGSTDKETLRSLTSLAKEPGIRVIRMPGPFNFSAMNNAAVEAVPEAEVLCFLNDDCHPLELAWLNDMVATALRPAIGAVGARLSYPDGRVQHAGIIWNTEASPGESALHAYAGLPLSNPGPFAHAVLMREWAAVTGACMVITRKAFEQVGGFDPSFACDYNDVDLCLRLKAAGYHNLVVPQALMVHHEGTSKRRSPSLNSLTRLLDEENRLLAAHAGVVDGNVSPNLLFGPHLNQVSLKPPPMPWEQEPRLPVLIIGGTPDDVIAAYAAGQLPYLARLAECEMIIDQPTTPNIGTLDLRSGLDRLRKVLDWLNIHTIILRSVGSGTLDILGMLTILAKQGMPVVYQPVDAEAVCPRLACTTPAGPCGMLWKFSPGDCQGCIDENGSPFGFVSVPSYRVTWLRFLNAIGVASDHETSEARNGILAASA